MMIPAENTYRDENALLFGRFKAGDPDAEAEIIRKNEGLVRSLASRFVGRGTEYDDLYQLGMIGLLRAVRSFDTERGCAFSTYAVPLITGEIKRFLRDDGIIKVSRDKKRLGSRLLYEKERFAEANGRSPHISELARICGVEPSEAAVALEATYPVRSIWEPVYEDGDTTLGDVLESEDTSAGLTEKLALRQVTSRMPELWQKIVSLRYYRDLSQEATARVLGLSQVKISREEKKIFEYLRRSLS